MLLLPSMLIAGRTYRPLVEELARDHRVIVTELPGTGRAMRVERPRSIAEDALAARVILDQLGVSRAVVIGHSNSGAVALRFALQYPERVRSLVLADTIGVRGPTRLWRVIAARAYDALLEPLLSLRAAPHLFWNAIFHHRNFFAQVRASAAIDLRREARRLRVPTLVAWGRHDHAMPRDCGAALAARIPRASFVLADGSHDWAITRPAAFCRELRAFLATCQDPPFAIIK